MYDKINEVEEDKGLQYLKHGRNLVQIQSVTVEDVSTANYNGKVIDVVFVGAGENIDAKESNTGLMNRHRIFPFSFNPNATDFDKNPKDKETQEIEYMKRVKHLFMKACGESKFSKSFAKVTSFETMGAALAGISTAEKGGNKFWLKLTDRNSYASVNGYKTYGMTEEFTEGTACSLSYNAQKEGPQQRAGEAEQEVIAETVDDGSDVMPWETEEEKK